MFNQKIKATEKEIVVYVFIDASNVWNAVKSMKKFTSFRQKITFLVN